MSDLDAEFTTATETSKALTQRPSNDDLLALYALYKQATAGDATGKRPGRLAAVDRAKFDAWSDVAGTSPDDAKQAYVDLVARLESS